MASVRIMAIMPHGHRSHTRATQSGSGLSRRGKCPPCLQRQLKRWRRCSTSLSDKGMTRRGDSCSACAGLGMVPGRTRGNMSRTFQVRRSADTAVGISLRCGRHPSGGSNPGRRGSPPTRNEPDCGMQPGPLRVYQRKAKRTTLTTALTAPCHRGGPVRPCAATHPGGPHSFHPNSRDGTFSARTGHQGQ